MDMLDMRSVGVVEELSLGAPVGPHVPLWELGRPPFLGAEVLPRHLLHTGQGSCPLEANSCPHYLVQILRLTFMFISLGVGTVTFALLILTPLQSHPARPSKFSTCAKGQEWNKKG